MTNNLIQAWDSGHIIRVNISMTPPLRWVNSYVLRGDEGITIVDPGPRTEVSEREWTQVFAELKISSQEIMAIIITHHHPDHVGMAGYLQSLSGAPVFMSQRAHEEMERMWGERSRVNSELLTLFRSQGLPDVWCNQLPVHLEGFLPQVSPRPNVSYLMDGSVITMGGRMWTAIESGGHAPGHLSFYNVEKRIMICGDAVLPQISPNISLLPGSDPQPLHSFMISLKKLGEYKVEIAFPGHRNPFTYFEERTQTLINHHEQRLERIKTMLVGGPLTGYEVCAQLFGDALGIHQMRFAMSETLAHLIELVRLGHAQMLQGDGDRADVYELI